MDFVGCCHLAQCFLLFENFPDHFGLELRTVALSHSAFCYPLIFTLFYCPIYGVHHIVKPLSKAFHNWFYAGWVVVDNKWAHILPETIRGSWEPLVSTEEFKRGLAILEKRNKNRQHKSKNFYLLQSLVYL